MLQKIRQAMSPTHPLRQAWHFGWEAVALMRTKFPSKELIVIGITGTNGKTTTANLLNHILIAAKKRTAMATTINFQIGKRKWVNKTKFTTAGRGGVNKFLRRAAAAKCTHVVLEVSSHALIQHRTLGVQFSAAALTNLTADHRDFHGSMVEYRNAKGRLFRRLFRNKRTTVGLAVLPAEDEHSQYFQALPHQQVITFGLRRGDLTVRNVQVTNQGQKFLLISDKKELALSTQLHGSFNLLNILTAIALARGLGVSESVIRTAVRTFAPPAGRLEPIVEGQPFRVVVDYAHTPDALEKLLRTFRAVTSGRVWLVFGSTGDRDKAKRPVMGRLADKLADEIVLTSDDPYYEDPVQIITEVLRGIRRKEGNHLHTLVDRKAGIRYALTHAQKDDTVLIAGKGAEMFQPVRGKMLPHDDRKIARQILRGRKAKRK